MGGWVYIEFTRCVLHLFNSQVLECLHRHFHHLSKPCAAILAPKQARIYLCVCVCVCVCV